MWRLRAVAEAKNRQHLTSTAKCVNFRPKKIDERRVADSFSRSGRWKGCSSLERAFADDSQRHAALKRMNVIGTGRVARTPKMPFVNR
ncbi:hypothetical protein ACNJX9_33630 [Bradyrhizobium sp. DASA03076]|uniref:hypothetical protein n=1 Tax=Bradyrhizobium sp. BLXBL-03 TaxID=3395916 RepID=UPI003F6FEE71